MESTVVLDFIHLHCMDKVSWNILQNIFEYKYIFLKNIYLIMGSTELKNKTVVGLHDDRISTFGNTYIYKKII